MSLLDAMLIESHRDPRDIWIALRTDGVKGSGTENDPFHGGTWELFDGLMRGFMAQNLEFITIHIGPGVFETKGTAPYDSSQGWEIRRGWKIVGSGIEVTVLKVVGAVDLGGLIVAIGQKAFTSVADYAEVMELTVDCNLPIPPDPLPPLEVITPKVAIAAVALKGSHTRIRRVRAIHFGTYQMFTEGDPRNQPECFVISAGGRASGLTEPTDCRIENCAIEHRAPNVPGRNNITCLSISAGEVARTGIMEHPRAGVIRNCYVNGAYADGTVDLIQQVWACSASGRGAVIEKNRIFNVRSGGPYHDTWSIRDIVVRHNLCHNVLVGPWEQMGRSSNLKVGSPLVRDAATPSIAIFTTFGPHSLNPNDQVKIRAAVAVDFTNNIEMVSTLFNGSQFTVHSADAAANTFAYQMGGTPQTNAFGAFVFKRTAGGPTIYGFGFFLQKKASIPPDDQIAVFTAIASHGLSDGDTVEIDGAVMWDGTGYTPANPFNGAFSITTVAGEPTKFTYQMSSVPENNPFPAVIAEKVSTGVVYFGAPMVRDGNTVTYTTVYPHGLLPGEGVDILEARANNEPLDPNYNGTFDIVSVPSPTQFTYALKNAPENLPNPAGSPRFAALWQVGLLVCENNVIKLAPSTSGTPHGIFLVDTLNHVGPYVFRRLVFRNNVIRHIAGVSDPNAKAIRIGNAQSVLVENNLIDLPNLHPIDYTTCQSIRFFNNRTTSGKLLRGYNLDTGRYADELETRIEEAVAMAFL